MGRAFVAVIVGALAGCIGFPAEPACRNRDGECFDLGEPDVLVRGSEHKGFVPATVNMSVGQVIRWFALPWDVSSGLHNVEFGEAGPLHRDWLFDADRGDETDNGFTYAFAQFPPDNYTLRAIRPGRHVYTCTFHGGMIGFVDVLPAGEPVWNPPAVAVLDFGVAHHASPWKADAEGVVFQPTVGAGPPVATWWLDDDPPQPLSLGPDGGWRLTWDEVPGRGQVLHVAATAQGVTVSDEMEFERSYATKRGEEGPAVRT